MQGKTVKPYFKKRFDWACKILQRDNFTCTKCPKQENLVVHHLDESRKLGKNKMNNDSKNLITLCKTHHAEAHNWHMRYTKFENGNIKELRDQGKTLREIASYFGVSRQRIHQLLKNNSPRTIA